MILADDTGRWYQWIFLLLPRRRNSERARSLHRRKKQCHFVAGDWVISLLELVKDLAEGWLFVESFDDDK